MLVLVLEKKIVDSFVVALWKSSEVALMVFKKICFELLGRFITFFVFNSDIISSTT